MTLSRERLELLCRIAEKKEADAQLDFADTQRRLASQQATEAELRGYLHEYEQRPLRAATPALLENQRQFLMRLRNAIDAQHQHAEAVAAQVELARQRWLEQQQALRVAESMLEQGRFVERRSEERKAQHEMDEFAMTRRPPQAYAN